MQAVITGDIINSSSIKNRDTLIKRLKQEFTQLEKVKSNSFSLYRGDAFQGICQAKDAFIIYMKIKALLVNKESDVRIAIGIGPIEHMKKNLAESDGTAFRLSGRTLDNLKPENKKFMIKTMSEEINKELELECSMLDALLSNWSVKSTEVIYHVLEDKTQLEIAELLGISQSAVQQRLKTANWPIIELFMKRYEEIVKQL
ncbi:hypothetical protein JKA74_06630 [Marivirga sp. S37H4]|uniref:RNA polymerase sigma-70 region 4 domain-containing protein n=1 Tax=Marivirga aurantiaca TaxID=2802615 RepID=A0A934WXL1_9BACT|nr:SatD family protein [Marivirga aurantiaca]MBK6264706.1 hypothetical protein [Marivirga aurantiaca]